MLAPDDPENCVTEVGGTLKSRSIVFGDPATCNLTISNNGEGSQMTITLPENFGRTAGDGTLITTQTYDMRSIIEAIMELNRRTAFVGSNCSFLAAIKKHQTTVEETDDPDNQFSANTTADGLPAARNGLDGVASDIDGTVITAESIAKLRQDIATLTESLNSANATILELSASYQTLYESTRIKDFSFYVDWEPYIYDLESGIIRSDNITGLQPSAALLAKGYYSGSSNTVFNPNGFDVDRYIQICKTGMFLSLHMSIPSRSLTKDDGTSTRLDPINRYGTAVNQNSNTNAIRFIFGTSSVQHARLYPDITISYSESRKPQIAVYAIDRLPTDYTKYTNTADIYSPADDTVIPSTTRYDITKTAAGNTLCSAKGPFGLAGHTGCTITLYYISIPSR